jgi:hypothetical protein
VIDNIPTHSYLIDITVLCADPVQVALNQPERAAFPECRKLNRPVAVW